MSPSLIASSAHLAGGSAPDLSEVEFGLMIASHAFRPLDGAVHGRCRPA